MHKNSLELAAELFKALSSEARLAIVYEISKGAMNVSEIVEKLNISQPLASQHLRVLKQAGIVASVRCGKNITYHLADHHVAHVVTDAIAHATEPKHNDPDTEQGE